MGRDHSQGAVVSRVTKKIHFFIVLRLTFQEWNGLALCARCLFRAKLNGLVTLFNAWPSKKCPRAIRSWRIFEGQEGANIQDRSVLDEADEESNRG